MLPSKEIRALAQRLVLVAVRAGTPRCAELRKEFSVPFMNSWVVVLDGKGETLASWIGDQAGADCDKRSVRLFATNLVNLVEESLQRGDSVQALERAWRKDPANREAFEPLAERLSEMHAYGKLQELCLEAAADPLLSKDDRQDYKLRAFLARANDHQGELSTQEGRARFIREGEKLLVSLAHHPKAVELPSALFFCGYAHGFDVPARSAQGLERLQKLARNHGGGKAVQARLREFSSLRQQWIDQQQEYMAKQEENPWFKNYLAAQLGDAEAAIALFSEEPYRDDPNYQEWLRQAKRKARGRSKTTRVRSAAGL